jgi:hypothetical protein
LLWKSKKPQQPTHTTVISTRMKMLVHNHLDSLSHNSDYGLERSLGMHLRFSQIFNKFLCSWSNMSDHIQQTREHSKLDKSTHITFLFLGVTTTAHTETHNNIAHVVLHSPAYTNTFTHTCTRKHASTQYACTHKCAIYSRREVPASRAGIHIHTHTQTRIHTHKQRECVPAHTHTHCCILFLQRPYTRMHCILFAKTLPS